MQLTMQVACDLFYKILILHRIPTTGNQDAKMGKTVYIQTDANTSNLVEFLLLEINDLKASVSRLTPSNPLQLFSEEEAAAILNVSKNTLITLRYEHKIHFHKINARILYSVEDLREFEEGCRQTFPDTILE
jgi:hypothetical protein